MKSGFPLQLEISSILRRRSYEVTNGVYFFDEDEKKARELDVEAGVPIDLTQFEDTMWQFNPWAIIECKKSRVYDWVFFNSEPPALHFDIGHSIDILTEKSGYDKSICYEILRNTGVHYHAEDQKYASAYEQVRVRDGVKKEKEGKDAILDATSKIVKFTNYRFQHLKRFFTEDSARRDIIFNFPIVVFEGDLYEASFDKTLDLKECQHIVYETRYLSALSGSLEPLYIDIVRKDALEDVLSVIEKEVASINKDLIKPRIQKQLSEIFEKRMGNR
jgi:hypothetical protein